MDPIRNQKPIVAVLTVADKKQLFRGNRANFRDIVKTGKELDFPVYVVTTKDLKLTDDKVRGYLYSSEEKTWKKQWFPLPNVVYNRIPKREDESKQSVTRKIHECINHGRIQLFNPYFFNKWKLFDWLKGNKMTRSLVPYTKRLKSSASLSVMLQQYKRLYLKPESGKAGKGIMLVEQLDNDCEPVYKLTIQGMRKKNVIYKTTKLSNLWKRLRTETSRIPYIMQEGIRLAKYENRHFDLRVLVQKSGRGNWTVTGVGARLAGPRRITTHVPQGGSVEDPDKMLTPTFGTDMTSHILNQLRSHSLLIARQIERKSGYVLGEMSMDLGVDTDGDIWFFEANAKPMKFDEPHIRKKSLERIFQFSQYLSNQPKE